MDNHRGPDPAAVRAFVNQRLPDFGRNKRQEMVRLIYEIAKREQTDYRDLLPDGGAPSRYQELKAHLMARRFPSLSPLQRRSLRDAFPVLDVDPSVRVTRAAGFTFQPRRICVESSVRDSALARRLRAHFPQAEWTRIASYKEAVRQTRMTLADYNRRAETVYVVREAFDFLLACPCSPGARSCGYQIMNLGAGCAFDCVYCYLQAYTNTPGIVLPANIDDFMARLKNLPAGTRIGTGQFTDSLIFDPWTGYAVDIVNAVRACPQVTFEFKTKSDHVGGLLSVPAVRHVVVGWSVNPPEIIRTVEFYTASLSRRLDAARRCAAAGYRVAFHFDPIVFYPGWEEGYDALVEEIFRHVPAAAVAWISLGTLRMATRQKQVIENRFPGQTLLDAELIPGFDGKWRYPAEVRTRVYDRLKTRLRCKAPRVPLYLCMEENVCPQGGEAAPGEERMLCPN